MIEDVISRRRLNLIFITCVFLLIALVLIDRAAHQKLSNLQDPGYNLANMTVEGDFTNMIINFCEPGAFHVSEDGEWLYASCFSTIIKIRVGGL